MSKYPKQLLIVAAMVLAAFALIDPCLAQNQSQSTKKIENTQSRDLWTDPSTGLTWAGRDNGKDVSWKGATKYCHALRLAAYSDWRLATLPELQGIFDAKAEVPGLAGPKKGRAFTWHVKGNLFLTGDEWSSLQRIDDRGYPSGYVWYFDFNEGRPDNDPTGWPYPFVGRRALCVRGPSK